MLTLTKKHKIGVLCGDLRSVYLALEFQKLGFEVYAYGLCEDEAIIIKNICQSQSELIEKCDVLILPLPATRDNIYIYSKSPQIKIKLQELTNTNLAHKIIFGGILPKYFLDMCDHANHKAFDYYKSEELVYKNATATAEGGIMIAMSNTQDTVSGSSYGVIGYGRIGKQLAFMLKNLGGKVCVFARNDVALSDAKAKGYDIFKLEGEKNAEYNEKIAKKLSDCSVIFNTVPSLILDEDILKQLTSDTVYIELASSPGGIDSECARKLKIKNIYAPSLPGRYSPRSAGKYIFDEIIKVLAHLDGLESEGL